MIQLYNFWAAGVPQAQPRPRATVRGGHARMYNPGNADAWKATVRKAAASAGLAGRKLGGPIRLCIQFQFQRPAAHFGTGANRERLKTSAPQYHVQRPDADNLAKAVMDALTDAGIWADDDQVYDLRVTKGWVSTAPGCFVEVWA